MARVFITGKTDALHLLYRLAGGALSVFDLALATALLRVLGRIVHFYTLRSVCFGCDFDEQR
jgi:hypothetical protein